MTYNEDLHGFESDRSASAAHEDADEIEQLRRRIQALQTDFAQADRRLRVVMRERPFVTLGAAVVAGFILGRVIGRS